MFSIALFIAPICCALSCRKVVPAIQISNILTFRTVSSVINSFCIEYIIVRLVGEVKWEEKVAPLPRQCTGGRQDGRLAHTGGPDLDQVSRALGQQAS